MCVQVVKWKRCQLRTDSYTSERLEGNDTAWLVCALLGRWRPYYYYYNVCRASECCIIVVVVRRMLGIDTDTVRRIDSPVQQRVSQLIAKETHTYT